MIESSEQLANYLRRFLDVEHPVMGVDIEADSLHRYAERVCLFQLTDGKDVVAVDPLAIDDLGELTRLFERATLWMHGADYDLSLLKRFYHCRPFQVLDTQIGARLLGVEKFGYASLGKHFLNVELSKSSQKDDWTRRPLTPKQLEYALNDVEYLFPLRDLIVEQLNDLGRYEWFLESCEKACDQAYNRLSQAVDRWRVTGAGTLTEQGLNFLKYLWHWRDAEAEKWDRPAFMVMGNKQMISMAEAFAKGKNVHPDPRRVKGRRRENFYQAVEEAKAVEVENHPKKIRGKRRQWTDKEKAVFKELTGRRDQAAKRCKIDPSMIASRGTLESLIFEPSFDEIGLMKWQRELLEI